MNGILEWAGYIAKCCEAITEGLKVAIDKWPRDRPGAQPQAQK